MQSGTNGSVFGVTVQDLTNPLYTFSAVPAAGTVAGLVTITTTGIPILVPIAPPPGAVLPPIVPVLLTLVPLAPTAPLAGGITPATPLADVVASINALSDPVAVVNAVAQLAPASSDLATPLVTFQGTQQFQNLLLERLDNILCGEANQPTAKDPTACEGNDPHGRLWIKAFGYAGDQGAQQAFAGYTSSIVGTMIGYDVTLDPKTRVGFGLGYASSIINAKGSGTVRISTPTTRRPISVMNGPWYINGALSFGWNDYLESRDVSFPGLSRSAQAN